MKHGLTITSATSNANKIVLDLCGGTGSWSKPYVEAGYDVRIITLPDYDVTTYVPPQNVYGILAAPPCTEFSILNCKAEARERNVDEGMVTVNACIEITRGCNCKFWALENPTGFLREYIGNPKYTFQPWWFGDGWTKRTDIWGEFNIPDRKYYEWKDVPKLNIYTRPNREKPSIAFLHKSAQKDIPQIGELCIKTDADLRAVTPPGFARAFFEANN